MQDCLSDSQVFLQCLYSLRRKGYPRRRTRGRNTQFILPYRSQKDRQNRCGRLDRAAKGAPRRGEDRGRGSQRVTERDGLPRSGLSQLLRFCLSVASEMKAYLMIFIVAFMLIDKVYILYLEGMLQRYNQLKEKLAQEGYDSALKYVDELPAQSKVQALLKTNFYCYLTIHCQYQNSKCLTILQECLADSVCTGGVRALTRYHLSQLFFNCDMEACGRECEEVVGEFIGNYHMLQSNAERSPQEEEQLWLLQYVLYYCLLMLGYMRRSQGRSAQSESYLKASQSLLNLGNRSSQFINASSLRTRSAQEKRRPNSKGL